jgi:hypothetical protein
MKTKTIAIILLLALSGCEGYRLSVDFNADGTRTYDIKKVDQPVESQK